ncbi:FKBP-type peptidyl-prolyl cis-trans isomerase [Corallincola spongiicola]|uniref:Peptidyl-prolyl cis-trans isomerase n=1 Tax=Corallincola spongiicola TaxID=2520508 RepID=A0ABY1WQA9_9GAMM|nr:FKBP-type peptidyl-prolyl cis-trans isomerase [Corallincola spongiicola]TAA46902.1 FKBP-type peptidyl-prolyl cis-trans isomerase [Corallincola spongiicola]
MKTLFKVSLIALGVSALVACQQDAANEAAPAKLETEAQKQAYALGSSVGSFIARNLSEHEALGIQLDRDMVQKGFVEGLGNSGQLSDQEIQTLLQGLDGQLNQARETQAEVLKVENKEKGAAYLVEFAKTEGVTATESGLLYEVMVQGEGAQPKAEDTVTVHYTGTLIDGTKFDSSLDRGQPAVFPLNRVIPGWTEGVQLMNVGSKYKFVIPSELAYGEMGAGTIPPNSTLIFEVELLDVEVAAAAAEAGAADEHEGHAH